MSAPREVLRGLALCAIVILCPCDSALAGAGVPAAVQPLRIRPGDVFVLRPPPAAGVPESALFLGKRYPPLALAGEPAPVFLLGADMDASPGRESVVVTRSGGGEQRLPVQIVKRVFTEERITLPPAMVTPPKELEERIAREQDQAAERGWSSRVGHKRLPTGLRRSGHARCSWRLS